MVPSRPLGPVPGLFERQSINLVIGTSGSGKTQFLFNQLENYATGSGFLGRSHLPNPSPAQMGLIACSREDSDVFHVLQNFPFLSSQKNFPFHMWKPKGPSDYDNLCAAYEKLNEGLPEEKSVKLLIVESFQLLMESGKILDTQAVKSFCMSVRQFCKDHDVTIVGTVGTPKMKGSECYPQLADRIPGGGIWAAEMNSLIGIERIQLYKPAEKRPGTRRIILQLQTAPDEVHWGKFDELGHLDVSPDYIPVGSENSTDAFMDAKLAAAKPGAVFKKRDLDKWGEEIEICEKTVGRWATDRTKEGLLKREGHTTSLRYIKPLEQ